MGVLPSRADPYIAVGNAKTKKMAIAFPKIQLLTQSPAIERAKQTIFETIHYDLDFMNIFQWIDTSHFLEKFSENQPQLNTSELNHWKKLGVEYLIHASLSLDVQQRLALEVYFYDTFRSQPLIGKKYFSILSEAKNLAHTFSNDIVKTLTGRPGIFLTQIAMSCDRGHPRKKKEIYIMNFDGSDIRQVTHHHSIAFAPAWSPDGSKLAYSLFTKNSKNIKNIDLYEFNFKTYFLRLLAQHQGINSGAHYSPDGQSIALTMSISGNPEIHLLDLKTRAIRQITRSLGFDVDPAWSPQGNQIAFSSSKTGIPMIYYLKLDKNMNATDIQRLTFAGRYNASPNWSPYDNRIVFAGWVDHGFDLFTLHTDGTQMQRLTKNQGSNEDPYYSPDGQFIVFSSNRSGQSNIYVMNNDGHYVKRLTYGLGNCFSPKWSNPPNHSTPSSRLQPGETRKSL